MKLKIFRIVLGIGFAAACCVLLFLMGHGASANYMENSVDLGTVVKAEDIANMSHIIDPLVESAVTIDFGNPRNDNYISMDLGADCTYRVEFCLNNKSVGSFVVDSGPWATISVVADTITEIAITNDPETNAEQEASIQTEVLSKSILHLIPSFIVNATYDSVRFTILRGNGRYLIANVDTHTMDSISSHQRTTYNVIDFEIKQFEIEIGDNNFKKLEKKRVEALQIGFLYYMPDEEATVPAKVTSQGQKYDAEINLKGRWLSNTGVGDETNNHLASHKWSMGIELKGDFAIDGLQRFSIKSPERENSVYEYLLAELYREQGGVAMRNDFADVYVNGEYKGVLATEEFMEKRVIEHSQKREGPILKSDTDAVFSAQSKYQPSMSEELLTLRDSYGYWLPDVYSGNRNSQSEIIYNYTKYAVDLNDRYFRGEISFEEAFDVDLYIKKWIVCDVFQATHGEELDGLRHYYNPVTGKLEPIPNEGMVGWYTLYNAFDWIGPLISDVLSQAKYRKLYAELAPEILGSVDAFLEKQSGSIERITTIIRRDTPDWTFDSEFIHANVQNVRKYLDKESYAPPEANLDYNPEANLYNLRISNYNIAPIEVIGLATQQGEEVIPLDGDGNEIFPISRLSQAKQPDSVMEWNVSLPNNIDASNMKLKFRYWWDAQTSEAPVANNLFSFYAMGHMRGNDETRMHENVKNYIRGFASKQRIEFGFLLGDLVDYPTEEDYADAVAWLDTTKKPYYAVPGNHDEADGGILFDKHLGARTRYFRHENCLFILLDPDNDHGMDDDQLAMIKQALSENADAKNVFALTHEIVWRDPGNEHFASFDPGTDAVGQDAIDNFYGSVLPLFSGISSKLFFVAGNIGHYEEKDCAFHSVVDGVTYIATGLGSSKDNVVEFNVDANGGVTTRLVALNSAGNPNLLGKLEGFSKYGLSEAAEEASEEEQ
jgi:hypothetical protein